MTKIVHAILIDPIARAVQVVRIDPEDNFGSAYKLIGCEVIEPAWRDRNGDALYVDEEGRLKANRQELGMFRFRGHEYVGKGILINDIVVDEDNAWTAPRSPFFELVNAIEFMPCKPEPSFNSKDILAGMAEGSFKVMTGHDFDGFAGAAPGSIICWDFQGWIVIVAPGSAGDLDKEALSVHAYLYPSVEAAGDQSEASYELTVHGWQEI